MSPHHADIIAKDLLVATDLDYNRDIADLRVMATELLIRADIIKALYRLEGIDKLKHNAAIVLRWINRIWRNK